MKKLVMLAMTGVLAAAAIGTAGCAKKEAGKFQPRLDTDKKVTLNTVGFFGNFEALDQVTNDFNQYYPQIEFTYEQVGGEKFDDYLAANPGVDILMTSEENFNREGSRLEDYCADLSKEDIPLDAIREDMLSRGYHGTKLSSIPMGQNLYGLAVNVSLLKREGLSIPENYEKFVQVLTALKEKDYTPIQGPQDKVYAELTQNMLYDQILSDSTLYEDLMAGKESAADALMPVCDKLDFMLQQGFLDESVNQTYPSDNYDQAILKFFEGDVPFWVCNTEKISGMKKRESKSEAYQADPFEYTYIFAPLGDNGCYAYSEPWFGFAVSPYSDDYEYAVEFIRFLATRDEINQMSGIKGVPSVAVDSVDAEIYQNVLNPENAEKNCVNEGAVTYPMEDAWYTCTNRYIEGEFSSGREMMTAFVEMCRAQDKK